MILVRLLYNDINASIFWIRPCYDALHAYVGLKLPFEQQACGLCGVRDSGLCHSIHPRDITLICLDERTQTHMLATYEATTAISPKTQVRHKEAKFRFLGPDVCVKHKHTPCPDASEQSASVSQSDNSFVTANTYQAL